MHCLTLKGTMDFVIVLGMVACLLLSVHIHQVQTGSTIKTLKGLGSQHLAQELMGCFILINSSGSTKAVEISKEIKFSPKLLDKICSCKRFTFFNNTFLHGIIFFNTTKKNETNIYLNIVCDIDCHRCLVVITNSVVCDEKFLNELDYQVLNCGNNSYKYSVRLKHISIRDFKFLFCNDSNLGNQLKSLNVNGFLGNTSFECISRMLSRNTDGLDIRHILKNCSLENSNCHTNCYLFEELRKLKFLLKRKCRFINDKLLHPRALRKHRRKRDTHIGKVVSHDVQRKDSTMKEIKRESDLPASQTTMKYENIGKVWIPEFNETAYQNFLAKEEMRRTIRREAEWAYLCLVFLSVLIVSSIWCLRGFHSRNTNKRLVTCYDRDHYLTVKEVLYKKARYLPMFNNQGALEEVFVHDCGTNTDSSRLDMMD